MNLAAPFPDSDTTVATLPNGARVVAIRLPHLASASVSVFVRAGSQHESARINGISHFVEHMAFKGTATRDCQRINLDAERLGAEVNAHTDKDHTAFHMRGLARDAGAFVRMLGDIVRNSCFPEAELERERQVILHEFIDDEDDGLSTAYKLFDKACFGTHPLAQPVIGTRRAIQRIARNDLLDYVQRQYGAANVVVGVAANSLQHLDEFFTAAMRLLREHAEGIDEDSLQRARNQITVRSLHAQERAYRRLEDAAQDLFTFGRVRSRAEILEQVQAVSAEQVRDAFAQMLAVPASVAIAGKVDKAAKDRCLELFAAGAAAGEVRIDTVP